MMTSLLRHVSVVYKWYDNVKITQTLCLYDDQVQGQYGVSSINFDVELINIFTSHISRPIKAYS